MVPRPRSRPTRHFPAAWVLPACALVAGIASAGCASPEARRSPRTPVTADSANLARTRLDLTYSTVQAPISGRTGRLRVHVGDLVKAADPANPIVTIHQLRPIRVRFTVPQAELEGLRRGTRSQSEWG